jgi:hypothetical protein
VLHALASLKTRDLSDRERDAIIRQFIGNPHELSESQAARIMAIKEAMADMAIFLSTHCPMGRELTLAITNLQQAQHWSVYAILLEPAVTPPQMGVTVSAPDETGPVMVGVVAAPPPA